MKVLVTGVYGFLGLNVANALVENFVVEGLYNLNTRPGLNKQVKAYNNPSTLVEHPDIIVMCHAAVASGNLKLTDEALEKGNVQQTENLIQLFPKARIIYISTVAVYGNTEGIITEVSKVNPENNYAVSKLKAENLVMQNQGNIIIRLSSLYGIGMKENTLIPALCNQALSSKKIKVFGNGARLQNYIHVNDVVELIKKVIAYKDIINFPILAVYSREYTNQEVASIIANKTQASIENIGEDLSKSFQYNNKVSKLTLNWQPKMELESGIIEFLVWKKRQS